MKGPSIRLVLTVFGVAACVALFVALWSIYRGAFDGAISYIKGVDADLWVLQRSTDNLMRGFSVLPPWYGPELRELEGVESIGRLVMVLAAVEARERRSTVYLIGYEEHTGVGAPPELLAGRPPGSDDEIVLDRSFARKLGLGVTDSVSINGTRLRVVGLSRGTNAIVMQYAFVAISRAQSLLPVPGIVTAYLLRLAPDVDPSKAAGSIRERYSRLSAYTRAEFVANNIRELDDGFLPILLLITSLAAVVLLVILTLILSMDVLERRRDFAIMKILGAPDLTLWLVVARQSLSLATAGLVAGAALAAGLIPGLKLLLPTMNPVFEPWQGLSVLGSVEAIAVVSASVAFLQTRSIYPLEAFAWRQ